MPALVTADDERRTLGVAAYRDPITVAEFTLAAVADTGAAIASGAGRRPITIVIVVGAGVRMAAPATVAPGAEAATRAGMAARRISGRAMGTGAVPKGGSTVAIAADGDGERRGVAAAGAATAMATNARGAAAIAIPPAAVRRINMVNGLFTLDR